MLNSFSGFLKYSLIDYNSKFNTYSNETIKEYNSIIKKLIPNKRTFKKYGINFIKAPTTLNDNHEPEVAVCRLFEINEEYISKYRFIYKLSLSRYKKEDGSYDDKLKVYGILK